MVNQETIKDIAQSLKTTDTQKNHTYQAIVSHIDNEGVVWVYVAGSDTETPTEAISSEVNPGDSVTVEWRNNKLYIAGNYSDPSAGMARTLVIQNTANQASTVAQSAMIDAGIARTAAESATESAGTAGRAASVAQAAAEAAMSIARMVFISEPVPPYRVGDLWVKFNTDDYTAEDSSGNVLVDSQGNIFEYIVQGGSDVYTCMTPRLEGDTFHESDWSVAATDNTQLNELREWFWHDANGAHVLGDISGYRNDISSTGMKIMDTSTETAVAEFGTSISFTDDRVFSIGNNNTYILFDPSDGGSITIAGGSRVNIGSNKTLDEVLTDLDVSVTQTATGADITVNGDTVSIENGQTGATGPEGVVTISISSVNWSEGTATLSATLRVNGTITSPSTYNWTKGTSTTSLGTSSTLSVSDLDAVYNCTVTW